jgi:dynein heavy chain
MNYGHRSMLRRECSRFLRLAYLLDFMVVEALGNMYIGSANDMVQKFRDLCKLYEPGPKIGSGAKKQYIEPLFYVNIEFVPNDIDSDEIKRIDVGNEVISPEDFDLECFAQFKVIKDLILYVRKR